jgi:adenine-specific DNA-methyltransferase
MFQMQKINKFKKMSKINILDDLQNQPNEKIEAIKKILPDCFDKDGNLIGEKLKEVLSGDFEKSDTERFSFNWAGKQKAREIAYKTYTEGTLKFDKDRSKKFNETQNLIIEGDNLQVLKLLKNSYKGKVKCIYIDPPYNTGNDFVYNDKFELDIKKYLIETGEIDEETGEQMADYIQKDDGKKHSKWLSFMYPRLMIAREMLREDGVIFISIDDNEVHHLRLLMNEVFGEREFVSQLVYRRRKTQANLTKYIAPVHEYILVFAKNLDNLKIINLPLKEDYVKKMYKNPDNDPRGLWRLTPLLRPENSNNREFEMTMPNGRVIKGKWSCSQETFNDYVKQNILCVTKDGSPNKKIFLNESDGLIPNTWLEDIGTSEEGSKEIENLFGTNAVFDTPKPVSLIKHLLQISTTPSDLILDFFAGSGTTGQAVMELNQEEIDKQAKDGLFGTPHPTSPSRGEEQICGGRKFILVQLPEKIDAKKEAFKAGYKKISDITIERVKRAGEKYKGVDNGFKVLQLADNPDRDNLWSLGNSNDNEFILTHLALLYGYGLNYKVEKVAKKEIYIMKSEIENTKDAIVILEKEALKMDDILLLIKEFGKGKYKFFSRDHALNIELTYNLLQHFKEDNVVVF